MGLQHAAGAVVHINEDGSAQFKLDANNETLPITANELDDDQLNDVGRDNIPEPMIVWKKFDEERKHLNKNDCVTPYVDAFLDKTVRGMGHRVHLPDGREGVITDKFPKGEEYRFLDAEWWVAFEITNMNIGTTVFADDYQRREDGDYWPKHRASDETGESKVEDIE